MRITRHGRSETWQIVPGSGKAFINVFHKRHINDDHDDDDDDGDRSISLSL